MRWDPLCHFDKPQNPIHIGKVSKSAVSEEQAQTFYNPTLSNGPNGNEYPPILDISRPAG